MIFRLMLNGGDVVVANCLDEVADDIHEEIYDALADNGVWICSMPAPMLTVRYRSMPVDWVDMKKVACVHIQSDEGGENEE